MVSGDFCEHDWPGSGCPECKARRLALTALEEVNGYIRTQVDCPCGEVLDLEGDASGETVVCHACKTRLKIVLVR